MEATNQRYLRVAVAIERALECGNGAGTPTETSFTLDGGCRFPAAAIRCKETVIESEAADNATHDKPLGARFAEALGRKDFDAVTGLLDPQIDFRGLTPGRAWEATGADEVVSGVLRQWFEDSDELDEIALIESGGFADRERVSYRFRGHNQNGPFVVEQQAYYTQSGGRINYLRVLCSGFRPR